MLEIECESKDEERFRVWCTEKREYVLSGVTREQIRRVLRDNAQRNADTWTDNLVAEALKIGEVPRRKVPLH